MKNDRSGANREPAQDDAFLRQQLASEAEPAQRRSNKPPIASQPAYSSLDEEVAPSSASPAELRMIQVTRVQKAIYFIANTIAIFLVIRLLLLLFNANPQNPFALFIFGMTAPFAAPFQTLFEISPGFFPGNFELGVLFGIPMYYLFAWIASRMARFLMMYPIDTE